VSRSRPDSGPQWTLFLNRLKQMGYFQDQVEGSQGYQDKIATAEEYFSYHDDAGDRRKGGEDAVAEER